MASVHAKDAGGDYGERLGQPGESLYARVVYPFMYLAAGGENTMYPVLEVFRAYAMVGESSSYIKEVFGGYRETPVT